jgi:type II secretory pathway predicted ATPase ExeA
MTAEVRGFDTVAVPAGEVVEVVSKYHRHFGLDGPPFEFDASPTSPFISTPHRDSLATLEWGLTQTISGLTLLVGEPGVGKTTLIKALMAQHPEWVQESGERAVVIVDEAEELTDANLQDLRLLSNTDLEGEKRLHFILVGRPELAVRLLTPALREIDRSIRARTKLYPLKFNEARSYVDYRLQRQGGSAQEIFNRRALLCLIAESAGIPRQINRLCSGAMAAACAQGDGVVTLADARAAVAEYRHRIGWPRISLGRRASAGPLSSVTTRKAAAAIGAGLAAAAAIVYLALADRSGRPALLVERAAIVRAAPPVSAGSRAPATSNPDRLAKEAADGTVIMPLRLDSKAVQGRALPSSVAQPVDSGGAISKGFQGDIVNGQSNNHFGFSVEPGQTSSGDPRAGYTERASPDDSSSLPTTERRSSIRHHRRPQNRKAPQLTASPDEEALDNTKPAQPMDKSRGVAGKAPILSLDPNWWVVPSR